MGRSAVGPKLAYDIFKLVKDCFVRAGRWLGSVVVLLD